MVDGLPLAFRYVFDIYMFLNMLFVVPKTDLFPNIHVVEKNKAAAASLISRKQGLGIPIHTRIKFILINIDLYTLLVLQHVLY